MIIDGQEILKRSEWLHTELLSSMPHDAYSTELGKENKFDVRLSVNGIETEPEFLNKVMNSLEGYIKKEAKSIFDEMLFEAKNKAERLARMIDEINEEIESNFSDELKYFNE